jgi:peroxiredoxin
MSGALPAFELRDARGKAHSFPSNRATLLCFVKEDCPTCGLTMPLIESAYRVFGKCIDVRAIGQDADGNAKLVERHALTVPMLDDSALKVSFDYGLDTVPTIILADADGRELRRFVGFGRDDWREMFAELSRLSGRP